jgi:hypothetical protein
VTFLADAGGWQAWFLWLSGWPVFLAVLAATAVFMLLAAAGLTRISHRSVAQNAMLAVLSVARVAFLLLGLIAVLTRSAFGP